LKPGSRIITEEVTYGEAIKLFRAENYQIIPIPMDEDGMNTEMLKPYLRNHSADMIFTIPNFHNPTGTTQSLKRREELLSLAGHYKIPIIEDDYIGDLNFDGPSPPSLKALAPELPVFYIGTFSKMLIPGLRFGYLIANTPYYDSLVEYKSHTDLTSPYLIQKSINSFINLGRYQNHIEKSRKIYRKRRDSMIQGINREIPGYFKFQSPKGGLFLWLSRESTQGDQIFREALKHRVKLAPGEKFQIKKNSLSCHFRLNFACMKEEQIQKGINKLAKIL
jgi:GntR family transcriptional regulator/MocR family aminotransferase